MADEKKPEPKKKFISDQDMWEISLDMVGDDSIDPTHRQDARDESRRQKETLSSRATTAPLKKPANVQRSQNAGVQQQPAKKTAIPTQQRSAQANATTIPAPSKPAAALNKNVQKTAVPKPTVQKTSAPKTVARPVAQQQARQKPQAASNPKTNTPMRTSVPSARPATKPVESRQAQQPAQKTGSVSQQRQSQQGSRREPASFQPERSQPAVFTTRDVSHRVAPQNLEDLTRKRRKEKFTKVAMSFWALLDFTWVTFTRLVKFLVKSLPVVWRHKLTVSVGALGFVAGYFTAVYTGQITLSDVKAVSQPATAKHVSPGTAAKRSGEKSRSNTKNSSIKSAKTETEPSKNREVDAKSQTPSTNASSGYINNAKGMNQFSGRDIMLDEAGNVITPTQDAVVSQQVAGDATNPGSQNVGQTNLDANGNGQYTDDSLSSANESTAVQRVEPEAAVSSLFEKKIQQMENKSSLAPVPVGPVVITDEIKKLMQQDVEAYHDKQWQRVIAISDQIIAIEPRIIDAYINRSIAHTELGMIEQAISDSNKAILLNPRNPLPINNRGYAYEKAGALDNAIADYQAACNLGIKLSCQETERLRQLIAPGE